MSNKNMVYVAFLRGINVGGNNKISMTSLKTGFEELGYENVQSYGNSGNIIFTAASNNPDEIAAQLEKTLWANFPTAVRVFIRSVAEMKEVLKEMPADWQTKTGSERKYDVIFLGRPIDRPQIIQELQPKADIDELDYRPGVLFWSVKVRDFSRSNLSKLIGTATYQEMTIRSPGVTRKVCELMSKLSEAHSPL